MSDFPPEPPPSWAGTRDRIEAALSDIDLTNAMLMRVDTERARRVLAGTLRKAFAPQLAIQTEQAATIDRVRALVRRHRHDDVIPKRELEAALYGEDPREGRHP